MWKWSHARGNGERPNHSVDGLSRSGNVAAGHAGGHGRAPVRWRDRGHGPHYREAGQAVRDRHLQEAAALELSPVGHRVQGEVRRDAEDERWNGATHHGTDRGTGEHMVGDKHVLQSTGVAVDLST
jgi:hypothetical protein